MVASREARKLNSAFGRMDIHHVKATHAYQYLNACEAAGRGPKANKEISLATTMLEYAGRLGKLESNPFSGVKKLLTKPSNRLVTEAELLFVLKIGRTVGGIRSTAALVLLCHKSDFAASRPQQGHCPRRAMSS